MKISSLKKPFPLWNGVGLGGIEMQAIDVICSICFIFVCLQIMIVTVWRFICLFRKKGSCKFVKCPFRKNYAKRSYFYFPETGCNKCPPTPEEEKVWRGSLEEVAERLVENEKRAKREKRAKKAEMFWRKG